MKVIIREGWHDAGKQATVLGPPVFVEQYWLPVVFDDEEDPTFFKLAGLRQTNAGDEDIPGRPYIGARGQLSRDYELPNKREIELDEKLGATRRALLEMADELAGLQQIASLKIPGSKVAEREAELRGWKAAMREWHEVLGAAEPQEVKERLEKAEADLAAARKALLVIHAETCGCDKPEGHIRMAHILKAPGGRERGD